jgi:GTP-binding protein of the ras superfamily involved in termination of M-phase
LSHRSASTTTAEDTSNQKKVFVKVAVVGDPGCGKTSLMVRFSEGSFDPDYSESVGVSFMEKAIRLHNQMIVFSVWDSGGMAGFDDMLPIVLNDALAVVFTFDLTRPDSLTSVKTWYRKARELNKTFPCAVLVGNKFDLFVALPAEEQAEVVKQARRFAKAMKAGLVFTSAKEGVSVTKLFKVIFSKVFDTPCNMPHITEIGEPILEGYEVTASQATGTTTPSKS